MTWKDINLRTYAEIHNILISDEIEQDEKISFDYSINIRY